MHKVLRIDDNLKAHLKPNLHELKQVSLEEGDILIVSAGFEDRAVAILDNVIASGYSNFTLIIIKYLPYMPENREGYIQSLCEGKEIDIKYLIYDRQNPAGIDEKILQLAEKDSGHIFIDISAMSRLLIVQLIVAFGQSVRNFKGVNIFYAEALEYPPHEDNVKQVLSKNDDNSIYRAMFISSGVFEVTIVPELSSVAHQGQSIRLISFPSFNVNQFDSLRGEIQPSKFSLIHGVPPLSENAWRREAIMKLNHLDIVQRAGELKASTLYYEETLDLLLNIYQEFGVMERIIIAPTGSKMQAVAVGIFRTFMKDTIVVYPTPRTFVSPREYTVGIRALYQLSLDTFATLSN